MESSAIIDGVGLTALPHTRFFEIVSSSMEKEGAAIQRAASLLSDSVHHLEKLLTSIHGRIFFTGIGKAGIVARKLSAVGASLGLQTFFLDPLNALHGDSGVCIEGDVLILISRSASGPELASLISLVEKKNVLSVVLSCKEGSLSNLSTHSVVIPCNHEADEYNVVPTNSSAVLTAFGDGLLLALAAHKGFHIHTFAQHHPAGALGKRLNARIEEVMIQSSELALSQEDEPLINLLLAMHHHQRSVGVVVNKNHHVVGVVTPELLRELHLTKEPVHTFTAAQIAHQHYPTISASTSLADLFVIMKRDNIQWMLVTENNQLKGLVELKALLGTS